MFPCPFKALTSLFTPWSPTSQTEGLPNLPRPQVPGHVCPGASLAPWGGRLPESCNPWKRPAARLVLSPGAPEVWTFPASPWVPPDPCKGGHTSSPPSSPNRMTPGSSSFSEPSPKPPKRSIFGWPNSPTHWASPGTAFPAPLRGLCPRGGVVSSGWKVKAKALSQLLPEAPPSRKSRGGAWPPGRLSGHSRGSALSGLPRSPWAKRGDRAEFKRRSWCRPPRSGLGREGREGGRARIQRRFRAGLTGLSRAPWASGRTRLGGPG